jgi:hypothetical protein
MGDHRIRAAVLAGVPILVPRINGGSVEINAVRLDK